MYQIFIATSHAPSRETLQDQCYDCGLPVQVAGSAHSQKALFEFLKKQQCDIILLTLDWADEALLRSIHQRQKTEVILIAPTTEAGIGALSSFVNDFVLTPVREWELVKSLAQAAWRLENRNSQQKATLQGHRIALPIRGGLRLEKPEHIVYLEADGSYTKVNLACGERLVISKGMAWFESRLEKGLFVRVHRSFLVNQNHIREIHRTDGGFIITQCGKRIQMSKSLGTISLN